MSDDALHGKLPEPLPETEDRPCTICGKPVIVIKDKSGSIYCTEHDPILAKELEKDGI